jgi:predicted DNA binding CopG/RHH family protein
VEKMVKTTIRLPESLVKAAKHMAVDRSVDFQDIVAEALKKYTAGKGGK